MYNKRQDLILNFIKDNPKSKRVDIDNFLKQMLQNVTKMTVTRDLKKLINDNLIEKSGNARATVYTASISINLLTDIDVNEYFTKEQDSRCPNKVVFNFDIFNSLKFLLTEKEKFELYNLNQRYITKKSVLTPVLLKKEFERITIEFAWKSSQIEGNTYTLLDTERLLKENLSAKGKTKNETNMILNHKKALDFILKDTEYYKELSVFKIEEIHKILMDKLPVTTGIRKTSVGIVGTNYKPLDNVYQIKEALQKLVDIINEITDPIEKALVLVLMIAYIQPFEDGNKRTSRILGNAVLLANNYCPLSYRSVDDVEYKKAIILFYEKNNASYFKKLFIEQFQQATNNL